MPNGFSGGPSLDYSGSDYLSGQASWYPGAQNDNSNANGSANVQPGDVLEVVGFGIGQVLEIIQGVATVQLQGSNEVVQVPVPVSVPTAPPAAPPFNWTPVFVGGGVLLVLGLLLGRR